MTAKCKFKKLPLEGDCNKTGAYFWGTGPECPQWEGKEAPNTSGCFSYRAGLGVEAAGAQGCPEVSGLKRAQPLWSLGVSRLLKDPGE